MVSFASTMLLHGATKIKEVVETVKEFLMYSKKSIKKFQISMIQMKNSSTFLHFTAMTEDNFDAMYFAF